jgi:hypothetical protein
MAILSTGYLISHWIGDVVSARSFSESTEKLELVVLASSVQKE